MFSCQFSLSESNRIPDQKIQMTTTDTVVERGQRQQFERTTLHSFKQSNRSYRIQQRSKACVEVSQSVRQSVIP